MSMMFFLTCTRKGSRVQSYSNKASDVPCTVTEQLESQKGKINAGEMGHRSVV